MPATGKSPTRRRTSAGALTTEMRIVILHGREQFLIEERTRELKLALDEAFSAPAVFTFDGETAELADILDELRSYGLLQEHKLVIVDNADKFLASREDGSIRRALERYAEAPVEHGTLLLRSNAWRPGKLDKLVAKIGAVVKCEELKEPAAASWLRKRAEEEYATHLDANAAALLVERIGTGLNRLDSELAKLATLVDEQSGGVTVDLVRTVVGKSREEQAWDIQAAILSGDAGVALRKFRELKEVSRTANELLSWSMMDLARKLHGSAQLAQQRVPAGTIIKEMRLWGQSGQAILRAARAHPPAVHAQLLQSAIHADRRFKLGLAKAEHSLECLAVSMADRLK